MDGWLRVRCPELHGMMYHRLRKEIERMLEEAMWFTIGMRSLASGTRAK